MNLFRSEEHVRRRDSFAEGSDEGITPLPDMIKLFSEPYFKRRMDQDYVSQLFQYAREMVQVLKEIGKTGPFWKRSKRWYENVPVRRKELRSTLSWPGPC